MRHNETGANEGWRNEAMPNMEFKLSGKGVEGMTTRRAEAARL
jgi:hypothetical protein